MTVMSRVKLYYMHRGHGDIS